MNLPAELVLRLRNETGNGMMDCKRALKECNNDYEKAKLWLQNNTHFGFVTYGYKCEKCGRTSRHSKKCNYCN